jgi:DNA-binding GntR family transcriptional regulator
MTASDGRVARRTTFREQIKEHVIAAVLRGDLKPGDRIVETRLGDALGVSQAPVREALRELELLGFVESSPFRGTQVCTVSYEELGQLYPLRAQVEAMAARVAAERVGAGELGALEAWIGRMHDAARRDDRQAHVEADIAFHRVIVEASGSRLLRRFWDGMQLHATTFLTLAVTRRSLFELAERHYAILDALRAHDPDAAEEAIRRHIEEPGAWVAEILRKAAADGTAPLPSGPMSPEG